MNKKILIIFILAILMTMTFCSKKKDTKGIELDLKLIPGMVTDDLYGKMKYSFEPGDKFEAIQKNYKVFVHFWRINNKEMLFQDDHFPMVELTKWEKGKKIEYTRDIYIPKFLDEYDIDFEGYEEIKLSAGLYDVDNNEEKITLYEKVINVQSASLNAPEIVYDEGWHQSETDFKSEAPSIGEWRWTKDEAVCIIENPKKDAILKIQGRVSETNFEGQKISLFINDSLLDEFTPAELDFKIDYIVPASKMGEGDEFKFIIKIGKTFVPNKLDPKNSDNRLLGIQIFSIYFRENIVE
ncbi:MAG: hypothetical protein ABFR75_00345 [Acidobacteriota bacterium]